MCSELQTEESPKVYTIAPIQALSFKERAAQVPHNVANTHCSVCVLPHLDMSHSIYSDCITVCITVCITDSRWLLSDRVMRSVRCLRFLCLQVCIQKMMLRIFALCVESRLLLIIIICCCLKNSPRKNQI